MLTDDAVLQAPPNPISPLEILPGVLVGAWSDNRTTALSIAVALSKRVGKNLPWATIYDAIDRALRGRYLVLTADSAKWPSDYAGAQDVRLTVPAQRPDLPPPPPPSGVFIAEAGLSTGQLQDLADLAGEILRIAAGHDLRFRLRVRIGDGAKGVPKEIVAELNDRLAEIAKFLDSFGCTQLRQDISQDPISGSSTPTCGIELASGFHLDACQLALQKPVA